MRSPAATRSPLATRSTNEDVAAGTPQYYKFVEQSEKDDDLLSPVPPPPTEEAPASSAAEELASEQASEQSSSSSLSWSARRAVGAYAAGHACFAYLFFTGTHVVSVLSWALLATLIANGMKMSITGRCTTVSSPSAEQSAKVVEFLSQAVNLFNRFKMAEPKLTFMTACASWALAVVSTMVSPLTLAWAVYGVAMRGAVLSPEASAKLNGGWQVLRAKAESLATDERLSSARAAIAQRSVQLMGLYGSVSESLATHSEQIKFVMPVAVFMGWLFLLGWTNKFLVGGMTLLAYKAWASPEAAAKFDAKIGKAARASRRMTLSAADRMGLMKAKVA